MLAYHGDLSIKEKYLARIRLHAAHDEIIKGLYWEKGKGCAVGCTIHGSDHGAYERELGIPRTIAHMEDAMFEHLPNVVAMKFPERFLAAITPGADLSLVMSRLMLWLLVDPDDGVILFADAEDAKSAIERIAALYERQLSGDNPSPEEWSAAAATACAAAPTACAAAAAACAAAPTACAAAAAAWAAAAWAAAWAAAAWAATAAEAAEEAWAAAAAEAAEEVWAAKGAAAKETYWIKASDKLIDLLKAAPVASV